IVDLARKKKPPPGAEAPGGGFPQINDGNPWSPQVTSSTSARRTAAGRALNALRAASAVRGKSKIPGICRMDRTLEDCSSRVSWLERASKLTAGRRAGQVGAVAPPVTATTRPSVAKAA